MEAPDFLSEDLQPIVRSAESDSELLLALTDEPVSLIAFFEYACEDPVWFRKHTLFIRQAVRWAAKQYFLARFPVYYAKQLGDVIRSHYNQLAPFLAFQPALFFTMSLEVEEEERRVNSFLFGTASPFFKDLFTTCFQECKDKWILPVSKPLYLLIEEFIETGGIQELWRLDEQQLLSLMKQAKIWSLPGLVEVCSETIKKFIHRENVIEHILEGQRKHLYELKKASCEVFNLRPSGLVFPESQAEGELKIEVLDFKEETLETFKQLAPLVTHLAFAGDLSLNRHYGEWIDLCPRLIGMDLSGSSEYGNQFDDLPGNLQELNLSACAWLRPRHLKEAGYQFPGLKKLFLNSNPHLDYQAWAEFHRFKSLFVISFAWCHQITDEDLKMIGKTCTHLSEIIIEDCSKITDLGLHELLLRNAHLLKLNCSHCENLTDRMLTELTIYTHQLTELIVSNCPELTEAALLQFLRKHSLLRLLNIKGCNLSLAMIEKLRKDFPFLKIID